MNKFKGWTGGVLCAIGAIGLLLGHLIAAAIALYFGYMLLSEPDNE